MMSQMRTTLTLDPDVAAKLKELSRLEDKSFKQLVNDLLRQGLSAQSAPSRKPKKFRVQPHRGGFRPGVDLLKLNQLVDQLDADDFGAEFTRTSR